MNYHKNQATIASKTEAQVSNSSNPLFEARYTVVIDGKIRKLELEGSLKELFHEADMFEDLREVYISVVRG